jgi:DNA invertase Pin-like site-specific DNA recombinase
MIYGYARVSANGQSVDAEVKRLRRAGAGKVFRETASGARADRPQLRRALAELGAGDVLFVTRLDRLARSTRDLLNTLAAIAERGARFRSLPGPCFLSHHRSTIRRRSARPDNRCHVHPPD